MQTLSTTEKLVLEAMMDAPERVWTSTQLAELVWDSRAKERPKSWRNSITALMRSVRTKTCMLQDNRVVRVSKERGRGNHGRYALRKTARAHSLLGE